MSPDQFRLDGQVALITGGSRNLGKAMTEALAAAGADCVICSRHLDEARPTADEISSVTGKRIVACQADVTCREQLDALVETTIREFHRVDILINNAGTGLRKPILEMSDDDWHRIIHTNLTAAFMLTRGVAPHMIARKYGRIINISSALGSIALPGRSAYCSSKGGLIQLTKVMALEWAQYNISVNCIAPGPFDTPYNRILQQDREVYEWYLNLIPQHRWAECKEYPGRRVLPRITSRIFYHRHDVECGWRMDRMVMPRRLRRVSKIQITGYTAKSLTRASSE